jgi:tRNA (guanine-N7-)-methyltransferase
MNRDLSRSKPVLYEAFWKERNAEFIPPEIFSTHKRVFLEIGAGTGWFFLEMAARHPDIFFLPVERDRMRGNRLVYRATRKNLSNVAAFRGNAIPALIHGIPEESLERIYILYPCPWPKTAHRKNRWYLHPIMPHLIRVLKPGGILVWASDQRFYIDEAHYVCEKQFGLKTLSHGVLQQNPYNDLAEFPEGRTKFEHTFLASGHPCHELIVQKN